MDPPFQSFPPTPGQTFSITFITVSVGNSYIIFIHCVHFPKPEYEGDQNSDQFHQEDPGHAQGILKLKIYNFGILNT